jgi:formylglycine-generating enzyme required for sulfatase activity
MSDNWGGLMTLQELQNQVLQLPIRDRWQLVQTLLESLKRETYPKLKRGNLSRLRGIAKSPVTQVAVDAQEDYVTYLTEKYQ